jgi:hypothetical protein
MASVRTRFIIKALVPAKGKRKKRRTAFIAKAPPHPRGLIPQVKAVNRTDGRVHLQVYWVRDADGKTLKTVVRS